MPVGIHLSLALPRDVATVPLVRHLCAYALREIRVEEGCIADIELAVTEACANVVRHAGAEDAYDVTVAITAASCEIRVVNTGGGFEVGTLGDDPVHASAESGRGVHLMRSLVDTMAFTSTPGSGTEVHLVKSLRYEDGAELPFTDLSA